MYKDIYRKKINWKMTPTISNVYRTIVPETENMGRYFSHSEFDAYDLERSQDDNTRNQKTG